MLISPDQLAPVDLQGLAAENRIDLVVSLTSGLYSELISILESFNDGIVIVDKSARVVKANSAFERLVGISMCRVLGLGISDIPELSSLADFLSEKHLHQKEYIKRLTSVNGCELLVFGNHIFFENDQHIYTILVFKDINHLNKLTKILQDSGKRPENSRPLSGLSMQLKRNLIAKSLSMRQVIKLASRVAQVDSNILILGETGVGKEVLAKAIHECSTRQDGPFIKVNCGAIPGELLESEMFGYEPGAFTGASPAGKKGVIELADGGTLFMDEIGDLPKKMQVKLLRVLQEREIQRIGSTRVKKVNFRVITATNKNLEEMIKIDLFRQDLYYRLNVVPIMVPPLRERKDDVLPLALFFLNKVNKKYGLDKKISPEVIRYLLNYDWPGNVRELENTIEHLVVICDSNPVLLDEIRENSSIRQILDTPQNRHAPGVLGEVLEQTEKRVLLKALHNCKTTREMADALGISQSAVVKKMKKHGIARG